MVSCRHPKHICYGNLLGLVVRRSTDAVELLRAAFLCPLALGANVVLHLPGVFFSDANASAMEPVGAEIAADVEPRR